jgi:hypothetical protein
VQDAKPVDISERKKREKEYMKGKIKQLEVNSKSKNIIVLYRGINEYRKGL